MITLEREHERALGVRPSVSAVIFDRRRRLLLQQRSDGGQWGLPGGSVEIGESLTRAVAREVLEETGLTIVPRRLIETLALDWFSPQRLPPNLLPNHRIRVRDARTRRVAAFVR